MNERTRARLGALKRASRDKNIPAEVLIRRFKQSFPARLRSGLKMGFWIDGSDGMPYVQWDGFGDCLQVLIPRKQHERAKLIKRINRDYGNFRRSNDIERALDCILGE